MIQLDGVCDFCHSTNLEITTSTSQDNAEMVSTNFRVVERNGIRRICLLCVKKILKDIVDYIIE